MKLRIEVAARNDLIEGYYFYEDSDEQVGDFFNDTLFRYRIAQNLWRNPSQSIQVFVSSVIQEISICRLLHHRE